MNQTELPLLGSVCECGASLIELQDGAMLCESTAKKYETRYGVPVAKKVK